MEKKILIITAIILTLFIAITIYFGCTPAGKATWNNWFFKVQKADDMTNYDTIKQVEDTCRAMIASYEADKILYATNINSENEITRQTAETAKMRANRTAANYNNYILKNSFVWKENIPSDIYMTLEVVK